MSASPCAAEFYEISHMRSTHRHKHMCQNFSQSVQGLRSSDTPKLPFPIDLLRCPYNSVALPYDTVIKEREAAQSTEANVQHVFIDSCLAATLHCV